MKTTMKSNYKRMRDPAKAAAGLKKRVLFLVGLTVGIFVVMLATDNWSGGLFGGFMVAVFAEIMLYVPFRIGFQLATGLIGKILLSIVIWIAFIVASGLAMGLASFLLGCATVADIGWSVYQYLRARKGVPDGGIDGAPFEQTVDVGGSLCDDEEVSS